ALIKREFIRGYKDDKEGYVPQPTYKQLAERHGCDAKYLRRKAGPSQEDWPSERRTFHTKKTQRITEKEIEEISDEAVTLDTLSLETIKEGITLIKSRLTDVNVSNHDIPKLTGSFTDLLKGYKLVLGEPTEHIRNEGTHNVQFNGTGQERILREEGYN
ncbi:MAG TPA: hypothetical protein PKI66_06895, partial [Methanobacteriaceae archaeon]|nr:hypothetical protein [Methanobacteriaceae archaeon]